MIDKLNFQVYSNSATEFTSLLAGGSDGVDIVDAHVPPTYLGVQGYADFRTDPRFSVTLPEENLYDIFGIDFNMNNTSFWGVPFNGGFDPTSRAENIRQGIAHLINRDGFIIQNLGGKGYRADCFAPYLQLAPPKGIGQLLCPRPQDITPLVPQNGGISSWNVCSWEQTFLAKYNESASCNGAYSLGSNYDASGAVLEDTTDFCAAAAHFILAGLANDRNSDCTLTNHLVGTAQTDSVSLWVQPTESGKMLKVLGDTLAHVINKLMGRHDAIIECGLSNMDAITGVEGHFLSPTSPPNGVQGGDYRSLLQALNQYNLAAYNSATACNHPWQMAALGWNFNQNPDQFYTIYNSQFSFNAYQNATYDRWSSMTEYNSTIQGSVLSAESAEYILGSEAINIPIWSSYSNFVYLNGWTNVVNQQGVGTANSWTALNAWSSNPTIPGVLRWGLDESTARLNVFTSISNPDTTVLGEVYESLFASNPYSPEQVIGWMANYFRDETHGTQPTECPASLNETGTFISVAHCIKVTIRGDIPFHDILNCVPATSDCLASHIVTASDVKFSLLNFHLTNLIDVIGLNGTAAGLAPQLPAAAFSNYGGTNGAGLSETFLVALSSQSPYDLGNLALVPIVPQHVWHSIGATGPCLAEGTPQCIVDPSYIAGSSSDPISGNRLIGSGPFVCASGDLGVTGTVIGGGCTSSGSSSVGPGGNIVLRRFGKGLDPNYAYFRTSAKLLQFQWAAYAPSTNSLGSAATLSDILSAINACKPSDTGIGGVVSYQACKHWNTRTAGLTCVTSAGPCVGTAAGGNGGLPTNPNPVTLQIQQWIGRGAWVSLPTGQSALLSVLGETQPIPQTLYEDGSAEGSFGIALAPTTVSVTNSTSATIPVSIFLSGGTDNTFPGTVPVALTTVQSPGLTVALGASSMTLNPSNPVFNTSLTITAAVKSGTYMVIVGASSPSFPSVTFKVTVTVT